MTMSTTMTAIVNVTIIDELADAPIAGEVTAFGASRACGIALDNYYTNKELREVRSFAECPTLEAITWMANPDSGVQVWALVDDGRSEGACWFPVRAHQNDAA